MRPTAMLRVPPFVLALSFVGATAAADVDPLALAIDPTAGAQASDGKVFVEATVGRADQRYEPDSRSIGRLAVDGRYRGRLAERTQAVVSARLDASDPQDARIDNPIFSLREVYAGWEDAATEHLVEFGRINLRQGPGYGFNPTDFFRDQSLRTINTQNPLSLRENRLGSVMLRVQRQWQGGSLAAAVSPKLGTDRSTDGLSPDLGATNARNRGLVSLGLQWSERLNTQVTVYREADSSARLGVSATALLADALVAHAEWSFGREPDLLTRAGVLQGDERRRSRAVAGLTYTTSTRLSLTAEVHYNGFALDRSGWRALVASDPAALPAYYEQAVDLQDSAARHALMLYAVQKDLGVKRLDLTALARYSNSDRSRMIWLDLRYRMDKFDLALQWQRSLGDLGSEYGSAPLRGSVAIVGTAYF